MTIRSRIILCLIIIISLGFYLYTDKLLDEVKPRYMESSEETLVDMSVLMAEWIGAQNWDEKNITSSFAPIFHRVYKRVFNASIYQLQKKNVDIRLYVTNKNGKVLFDSKFPSEIGKSYHHWRDVALTLSGEYGARSSSYSPLGGEKAIFVSAPIFRDNEIYGVLTIAKPKKNVKPFIDWARKSILEGALYSGLIVILLASFLFYILTRPIKRLTEYVKARAQGKNVLLPHLGKNEIGFLGEALEEMRLSLEGKKYIEKYLSTLTHEIKSPLSAIRGSAELLKEDLPVEEKNKFISHILTERERIERVVERLLLLSSIETKGIVKEKNVNFYELSQQVTTDIEMIMVERGINFIKDIEVSKKIFKGDPFLLYHMLLNILNNSIDFTKPGQRIKFQFQEQSGGFNFKISDEGEGIPDYALDKIFERFFSLPRPMSGKKSSGLGLCFVKQVVELHNGHISILNRTTTKGVKVSIKFSHKKN